MFRKPLDKGDVKFCMDVKQAALSKLFESVGFSNDIAVQYSDVFEKNNIGSESWATLDPSTLSSLGITSVGHQVRILHALQEIKEQKKESTNLHPNTSNNVALQYEDIQFGRLVGTGHYGEVYSCRLRGVSGLFAVKKVPLENSSDAERHMRVESCVKEISLLRRYRHENIIRMIGCVHNSSGIFIVMDLCDTSLHSVIQTRVEKTRNFNKQWFAAAELFSWCKDVLNALQYLHSVYVAHRDIKSPNILVNFRNVSTIDTLVLADFGVARQLNQVSKQIIHIIS